MTAFSLETIDYQLKDRFGQELSSLIASIFKDIQAGQYKNTNAIIDKHPAVGQIETLVRERLGLCVEFVKDLWAISPAAIIPFFGDYMRGYQAFGFYRSFGVGVKFGDIIRRFEKIEQSKIQAMKKAHLKKGWIDFKRAKVGGYLSELRHHVLLDFVWLYRAGMTPEESAAILSHELGHAFDGLEEHYRLNSTNRAIFDILVDLRDGKEEQALYTYHHTFTHSEFKQAQLNTSKERHDFCGELAMRYLDTIEPQYLDGKYDETNFENMADSFATRFGMGKDIVSGLHKLHEAGGALLPRNIWGYGALTLFNVLAAAMTLLVFPPFGMLAFVGIAVLLMGKRNANMTYDLPTDRYQRIRNTLVNALKDTQLPAEVSKDLLEQIAYIDPLIEGFINSSEYDLMDMVANFVSPSSRKAIHYIELQQSMERSLNNELFVKAAQLRTM